VTKPAREFWWTGVVAVVMAGFGCGPMSTSPPTPPPIEDFPADALADYLPPDAVGLLTVNVRQILDSPAVAGPLRDGLARLIDKDSGGQHWLHLLGVHPLADVDCFQMIYRRGAPGQPLVLVRGRFQPARFRLGAGGLQEVRDGPGDRFRLYEFRDVDEEQTTSLALAGDYLVACATRRLVVDALNYALAPDKVTAADESLRQALARVDRKQGMWLSVPLARLGPIPRLSNKGLELILRPVFRLATSVEGGLSCDKDVRGEFRFTTATDQDSDQLDTALKSVCELAQTAPLLLGKDKDVRPFLALLATGETSRVEHGVLLRCRWMPE
jgi:hypothetical protein